MDEYGFTRSALADEVNEALHRQTGEYGQATERWVYALLSGAVLWPHERQRRALESVLNASSLELGFIPRGRRPRLDKRAVVHVRREVQPDMQRRQLFFAAGAITLGIPNLDTATRIGMSDLQEARLPLVRLIDLDQQRGGLGLSQIAAKMAKHIEVSLSHAIVSDRVRRAGYALAGEYLGAGAWFAIDAGRPEIAPQYINDALRLASISQNGYIQAQVWNALAWCADISGNAGEVLAIAQAGLGSSVARRDGYVSALFHGWAAIAHGSLGQRSQAERSIGRAHNAVSKGRPDQASEFFIVDHGEVDAMAIGSYLQLGSYEKAESCARSAVANSTGFTRNGASRSMWLAETLLSRREVEEASAVSRPAISVISGAHSGRLDGRLENLARQFSQWSDVPEAHDWVEAHRSAREDK